MHARPTRARPITSAMLLALVLIAPGCGADDVVVSGTTSVASSTVGSSSTTASSSSTTTMSPESSAPTTIVGDDRLEPACVERDATAPGDPEADPQLGRLVPLGVEPVLQVVLPRVRGAEGSGGNRVKVHRIAGGVLLETRPYDGPGQFGVLVAIDGDGVVRWQRCLDPMPDLVLAPEAGGASEMLLRWSVYGAAGLEAVRVEVWSLATGASSRTWEEFLEAAGVDGGAQAVAQLVNGADTQWALGPWGTRPATADDTVVVVDAETLGVRSLPMPPAAVGSRLDQLQFGVAVDGRLLDSSGFNPEDGGLHAVEHDGGWSTDPALLAEAAGLRVGFTWDQATVLRGIDARGDTTWRRDDISSIRGEGFRVAVDGGVALVVGCSDRTNGDESYCPDEALLGVDAATGRTIWRHEGMWSVSLVADGVAVVAGPYSDPPAPPWPAWRMIDLTTGRQVGDTTWDDPWHFGIGCCDEPMRAYVSGGVVFTVDLDTVEVWYPAARSHPTVRVTLG